MQANKITLIVIAVLSIIAIIYFNTTDQDTKGKHSQDAGSGRSQTGAPGLVLPTRAPHIRSLNFQTGKSSLVLKTSLGAEQTIDVQGKTVVFAMTSYCPGSNQINQFFKKPQIKKALSEYRIIYVYGNEWNAALSELEKEFGKEKAEEKIKVLKEKAGNSIVLDPSVFDDAYGEVYFAGPEFESMTTKGYPAIYDPLKHDYSIDVTDWIIDTLSNKVPVGAIAEALGGKDEK